MIHLGKIPHEQVVGVLPRLLRLGPADAPHARRGKPRTARLILETPAVKPKNSQYETPEKLAQLFRAIRRVDPRLKRVGLCIDTAHLWACGVDLETYEAAERWLQRLEAVSEDIPSKRIMFHINDSASKKGSGVDRHAPLLHGLMWGGYRDRPNQSGLAAFVAYADRHGTVAILERKPPEALLGDYSILERLTKTTRESKKVK